MRGESIDGSCHLTQGCQDNILASHFVTMKVTYKKDVKCIFAPRLINSNATEIACKCNKRHTVDICASADELGIGTFFLGFKIGVAMGMLP